MDTSGAVVEPAALAASLAFARLHLECDDEFCRSGSANGEPKVHPGPCRGWKDTLRKVAPGVHKILEDERKRKLAERRSAGGVSAKDRARVGTSTTRGGDEIKIVNSGAERRADEGLTARVTSREADQVFVEYPDGRTGVLNARNVEVTRVARQLEAADRAAEAARLAEQQRPVRAPTRLQVEAIEAIGRSSGGLVSSRYSPQMRRALIEGGHATESEVPSLVTAGRMTKVLTLTPKGQAVAKARQDARDLATRKIHEQAVAEGLDPVEAKLGGLPHARAQRDKRKAEGIAARAAEAERGAPPDPGDTAGMGVGYGDDNHTRALTVRAKIQADLLKAIGGAENVTPEQRQRVGESYRRYLDSYAEVDGHRRHVQAWADRLAYLSESRDHADPATRPDIDRLIGEARAGHDKAVTDLAEAGKRAEASRDAAGEAIASVYREHGKRKTVAALKLPLAPDATPPDAKVRHAAEVDRVARQAGADEVPVNAPERHAVERAVGARLRQEREVTALKAAQERNHSDRVRESGDRQRGNRGPESDARMAEIEADGKRIAKALGDAKQRLSARQDEERIASNRLRQHVAGVREAQRRRDRGVAQDEMDTAHVAVVYRNASERLARLDEGERSRAGNRLRSMIDSGADPALIIAEAEKEARRAGAEAQGGTGYQSPVRQDDLLRAQQAYESVARMIRESGATTGPDTSSGGAGDTPLHRGALAQLREAFDGSPRGDAAELQALLVAGDDPAHIGREATRLARGLDRPIEQAGRSRTSWRTRVELLREQQAYESVARTMEGRDTPDRPARVDAQERTIARDRAWVQSPAGRLEGLLGGTEGAERERGAAYLARVRAGEDPKSIAAELRAHAAREDARTRSRSLSATERNGAQRNRSSYLDAARILDSATPAELTATKPGVDAPVSASLVASLVAMMRLHEECDDGFCLHGSQDGEPKVHPGPCRGWKETLRKVAPGVHKILEDERKRKLAEKRAGKIDKPKIDKPPEPDRPVHLVELRPETLAAVNDAARSLPADEAGWHALSGRTVRPPIREIDQMTQAIEARLPASRAAHAEAVIKAREQVRKERYSAAARRRKTLTATEEERAQALAKYDFDLGGRALHDDESQLDSLRSIDADIAAAKAAGTPLTTIQASYDQVSPQPPTLDNPLDANGVRMPPPALVEAQRRVSAAGRALQADLDRAYAADPEMVRLRQERNAASDRSLHGHTTAERIAARRDRNRLDTEANVRRRVLTLDALAQVRSMGGERHTRVVPLGSGQVQSGTDAGAPARNDWQARLEVADQHYPDDWTRISARSELRVQASDRAFYSGGYNGWETRAEGDRGGTVAMNTDNNIQADYRGGFADYVDEVTVHEMGHRMEQQIPGLRALEFAWVREQTTRTGADGRPRVEPIQRLIDVHPGSGYGANEVSRPDDFANGYTGREYATASDPDPARSSWEVFQVGIQEVYGNSRSFGNGDNLRVFALGVLATLGRTS